MERTEVIVQFFLGKDEDSFKKASEQFYNGIAIPQIGQKVTIWGTRDKIGDYVYEGGKLNFKGIVHKIEHIYEQRGMSSIQYRIVHFVSVFLIPDTKKIYE